MNDSDSGFLTIPIKILLEDLKDPFFYTGCDWIF